MINSCRAARMHLRSPPARLHFVPSLVPLRIPLSNRAIELCAFARIAPHTALKSRHRAMCHRSYRAAYRAQIAPSSYVASLVPRRIPRLSVMRLGLYLAAYLARRLCAFARTTPLILRVRYAPGLVPRRIPRSLAMRPGS